ncbi:MAG: hypothetical protein N3H31_06355 [Candidatus Nezhaarchaeota archaeon]|nr:hypothetical protein [Candidatus Nezhaarchaeota archaeon]
MTSKRLALLAMVSRQRLGQLWLSFPQLAVLSFRKLALLADHFKSLVATIAKTGLSVPLSSMTLKRRRDLGLPELTFSAEEARRLLERLKVMRAVEGSR